MTSKEKMNIQTQILSEIPSSVFYQKNPSNNYLENNLTNILGSELLSFLTDKKLTRNQKIAIAKLIKEKGFETAQDFFREGNFIDLPTSKANNESGSE